MPLPASLALRSACSARWCSETPSSSGSSSATPPETLSIGPDEKRAPVEPRLHAGEKPLGIDPGRRRQDDRELVPADPAREVGGTDAPDNGVRDLNEQFVSRDLAELCGGRAKVVDVEHTDGELAPLAVCSRHLEGQRLVEQLTVAEPVRLSLSRRRNTVVRLRALSSAGPV